ncbi:MAG TPA: histidine kinase [Nocardioidaceae bacterium]|jgi:two-component system LytT family sensor kinase
MTGFETLGLVVAVLAVVAIVLTWTARRRDDFGTTADRATFRTLHTASLASPPLREGLTTTSAEKSLRYLRTLLGAPAAALTDTDAVLGWDGGGEHHRASAYDVGGETLRTGATSAAQVTCEHYDCSLRHVVTAPLTVGERVVGTLQVYVPTPSAGLVRATNEVAGWVSTQLELAEVDESRARIMEAEVRALRAQISPHFIYNSLSAIASFVRTDPERARELLLEFADFTRYSFRRHGEFSTLAEELRSIERYLVLEKARFGDRLSVTLRVAPEALPVTLPFLCLQPLVENAVRHGLEGKAEAGHITIDAEDAGSEVVIAIEDDGVGEDPERVRRALAGDSTVDSVGLGNVDERLRSTFGDDYGLVIETGVGAGTRVVVRVPKYAPGVHT